MVGWHHQLNGHEFGQTLGVGEGQGSLGSMGLQRVEHDLATEQRQHLFFFILAFNFRLTKNLP